MKRFNTVIGIIDGYALFNDKWIGAHDKLLTLVRTNDTYEVLDFMIHTQRVNKRIIKRSLIKFNKPVYIGDTFTLQTPNSFMNKEEKYNYYKEELSNIINAETPLNIQISNDNSRTKWIALNEESLPVIISFLEGHLQHLITKKQ